MKAKKRSARKLPNAFEQAHLDAINRIAMRLDLSCIFDQAQAERGVLVCCDMWKSAPMETGGRWEHYVRNLTSWEWELVDIHDPCAELMPNIRLWPLKHASDISMRYTILRCVVDRICEHAGQSPGVAGTLDGSVWKGALAERVFRARLRKTCFSEDRTRGATRTMTRFLWDTLLPKPRSQLLIRIHGYSCGFGVVDAFRLLGHEDTATAWKNKLPNAMPLLAALPAGTWPQPDRAEALLCQSAPSHCQLPRCTSKRQAQRLLTAPYTMVAKAVEVGADGGVLWGMNEVALARVGNLPVRLRAALVIHCSAWPRFKHVVRDKLMDLHLDYLLDRLEEMQAHESKTFAMYYHYCATLHPVIDLTRKICKTRPAGVFFEGTDWEDFILDRLKGYHGALEVEGHAGLTNYMHARKSERIAKALAQSMPLTTGQDQARNGLRRL